MHYNVHAGDTQLAQMIDIALRGEEVVISKDMIPVARLVAIPKRPIKFGVLKGIVKTVPDFLEPMSEDDLALWEGRGDGPDPA
jgi:antitoxin (DNA-binding transcriptional repressor) of toxin-antitoxin stability system